MIISRLKLKNWRNFREVDVPLRERQFIVGPNASGKSNLLDAFRFLRDIAKRKGGGLQAAIENRGGLSKLRCLNARQDSEMAFEVSIADSADNGKPGEKPKWRYAISIKQEPRGLRQPYLEYERVWDDRGKRILDRPNAADKKDGARLKQTFLEQVNSNAKFREVAGYLAKTTYLHLVPQLLRYADDLQGRLLEDDPFGQGFLARVAETPDKTRQSRLSRIEKAIKNAVPKLQEMQFERDKATGGPHIKARYSHWRPNAGWQREDQFSDGALRLIALLWAMMDGDSLLLLEEPELSLHEEIVCHLAPSIYRIQRQLRRKRQVLISTHSSALLSDKGIDGRNVLLLIPGEEGTEVKVAADLKDVKPLLVSGLAVGEVVIPRTAPGGSGQLPLSF